MLMSWGRETSRGLHGGDWRQGPIRLTAGSGFKDGPGQCLRAWETACLGDSLGDRLYHSRGQAGWSGKLSYEGSSEREMWRTDAKEQLCCSICLELICGTQHLGKDNGSGGGCIFLRENRAGQAQPHLAGLDPEQRCLWLCTQWGIGMGALLTHSKSLKCQRSHHQSLQPCFQRSKKSGSSFPSKRNHRSLCLWATHRSLVSWRFSSLWSRGFCILLSHFSAPPQRTISQKPLTCHTPYTPGCWWGTDAGLHYINSDPWPDSEIQKNAWNLRKTMDLNSLATEMTPISFRVALVLRWWPSQYTVAQQHGLFIHEWKPDSLGPTAVLPSTS